MRGLKHQKSVLMMVIDFDCEPLMALTDFSNFFRALELLCKRAWIYDYLFLLAHFALKNTHFVMPLSKGAILNLRLIFHSNV